MPDGLIEPTEEQVVVAREWMTWFVSKYSLAKRDDPDDEARRLARKILNPSESRHL